MLINTVSAIVHDVEVSITFHMYDIWQGFLTRRTAHRKLQPVLTKKNAFMPRTGLDPTARYKTDSLYSSMKI
jgi:hypothetical protein